MYHPDSARISALTVCRCRARALTDLANDLLFLIDGHNSSPAKRLAQGLFLFLTAGCTQYADDEEGRFSARLTPPSPFLKLNNRRFHARLRAGAIQAVEKQGDIMLTP